jgi:hypothetical protein
VSLRRQPRGAGGGKIPLLRIPVTEQSALRHKGTWTVGMSKSFLSFSYSRINSTVDKLGVSMGKDINVSISNLKALEYEQLEQASKSAPICTSKTCDSDDNISDTDSDLGWNQQAIQHLVGDIADDILNTSGSRFDDFNLGNRKSNMVQPKRVQRRRKPEIELNISNERDILG